MKEDKKFKDHTGILFHNDYRTDENNQPHFRGKLNLPTGTLKISAWKNDVDGKVRLSLKTEPDAAPGNDTTKQREAGTYASKSLPDDDIPF